MATSADFIKLAQTLPPRLTRFFARYPPNTANDVVKNPFKPTIHPVTKKWHNPVYSLRRQKELVVLARDHGVEDLLPPTIKKTAVREKRALEGPKMKKMMSPKGKEWERTLKGRLEMREKAMRGMPNLIERWRKAGHGRGWTEWPR
ncbi:hypothetical protein HOY80DRAFT_348310 [Tuber brumale]|nr:hypothetical protein HOY80DRAFT_348310 [Tuber brumale]